MSDATSKPDEAHVEIRDGLGWDYVVRMRRKDTGYACIGLGIAHDDQHPVEANVLRDISIPELLNVAVRTIEFHAEKDRAFDPFTDAPSHLDVPSARRGSTDAQLRRVAALALEADERGLSRAGHIKNDLGISMRTAYRRIKEAQQNGYLEEDR